jgi:hypothetical protein
MIARNQTASSLPTLRDALRPKNSIFRAAAVMVRAKATNSTVEGTAKKLYGKDHGLSELFTRAASTPASLTIPGWAGLTGHDVVYSHLIQKITALSAAASLMTLGLKVDLTGVQSITIPGRTYNPASAGDWIAEGAAIPVRHPTIAPGPKLQPRKLGVLSTFSREMAEADSLEEFTTAAIKEGAAALLDLQMFSTNAGDASHPPGILIGANTVTASTATGAGGWIISADIGALVQALATNGAGLEPIIIAAPAQAAALRMWRQADFFPILSSVALPAGTVVAVEASSFVSGLDGLPEFDTSKGATLHMEDTTPTDIVVGGAPATPTKSLFQTDVTGLRMILRASWAMRNQKHVAIVSGVSW